MEKFFRQYFVKIYSDIPYRKPADPETYKFIFKFLPCEYWCIGKGIKEKNTDREYNYLYLRFSKAVSSTDVKIYFPMGSVRMTIKEPSECVKEVFEHTEMDSFIESIHRWQL